MNQAIQFIDRLEFREPTHQLVFFAQVNGMIVECVIAVSSLNLADESHATRYFEQYRLIMKNVPSSLSKMNAITRQVK